MSPDIVPSFEGSPVEGTLAKVTGSIPIDEAVNDYVLRVDDVVNTLSSFRVTGVNHIVDKDGKLVRVHTLKPIEMALFPLDPNDPNDNGIVSVRPVIQSSSITAPGDEDGDED